MDRFMNGAIGASGRLKITATHTWVAKINTLPAVPSGAVAAAEAQRNKNNHTDNDARAATVTRDDQRGRGMFTLTLQRKRSLTRPAEAGRSEIH